MSTPKTAEGYFDRHLQEKTSNGNLHPSDDWYERDYRDAEEILQAFNDLNWHGLKKIFAERSHIWQEACVFVLGEYDNDGSVRTLTEIFLDGSDKISCYVAIFLSVQDGTVFGDKKTQVAVRVEELIYDDNFKQFGGHYLVTLEKLRDLVK